MRKIAFINVSAATGKLLGELARREQILRAIASPDTRVDIVGLETDPKKSQVGFIESAYDAAMEVPKDLKCAMAAEKAGYQALIISCAGDPGANPLREVVKIPVISPGATAKNICSLLGKRFSILTPGKGAVRRPELHEKESFQKLISVHPLGFSIAELRKQSNIDRVYEAMIREGKKAIEDYGAHSLTFGCMSLGFLMLDDKLTKVLGIPVVNLVKTAVKTAEMFIDLGLTHSKVAFPMPKFARL